MGLMSMFGLPSHISLPTLVGQELTIDGAVTGIHAVTSNGTVVVFMVARNIPYQLTFKTTKQGGTVLAISRGPEPLID